MAFFGTLSRFRSLKVTALESFNSACRVFRLCEAATIASNMTSDSPLAPREKDEPYSSWLVKTYKDTLVPKFGPEKGHEKAVTQTAKQLHAHDRLTSVLSKLNQEKKPVVAPGTGFAHEQVVAPQMRWRGFEYQKNNVDGANERNQMFGVPDSENKEWSLYKGSLKDLEDVSKKPADQVHPDWETRLGNEELPKGEHNFMYLKHFCGGGTDASLKHAVEQGYHGVVAHTCCSNRYTGISHCIIGKHANVPWSDYKRLVSSSGDKESERGLKAQLEIDSLRKKYLEDHGYEVRQGWFGKSGEWEPSGGFLFAVRKDQPHLVKRLKDPELLKGHEVFSDSLNQ